MKTNSGVPAPPAATAVAPTTQSKGSGANTTLEIVSQLDVQDANRFFQKFQGPVMYAAVAGCAGLLLLIVVVVVVVLKKRNSDRLVHKNFQEDLETNAGFSEQLGQL